MITYLVVSIVGVEVGLSVVYADVVDGIAVVTEDVVAAIVGFNVVNSACVDVTIVGAGVVG